MGSGKIKLTLSNDDDKVGYVSLPQHPGSKPGVVSKSVELRDLFDEYKGPDVVLDFDAEGTLIGIEILG